MKIRSAIFVPLSLSLIVAGSLFTSAPVAAASPTTSAATTPYVITAVATPNAQTAATNVIGQAVTPNLACLAKYNFTATAIYYFDPLYYDQVVIKGTACANGSTSWGYSVSYGSGDHNSLYELRDQLLLVRRRFDRVLG